ncbi:putative taste receptor type 2 member 33 [Manis javanica]|nr:putative taste receptor type 2 member 33 [Manis javanica]
MVTLLETIISILVVIVFVLGNLANGLIVLVNCNYWVKRQKISSADRILTALAVSRIGLLWVIVINWYTTMFNPALYCSEVRITVSIAWAVSNHFSIWLATSLSIFYLLKIANFSGLIFLYLKWRVNSVLLGILLGPLVFLFSLIALASLDDKMPPNECEGNMTWKTKVRDIVHLSNMSILTLANTIPFAMSLASFLLLIFSLWKHVKKMKLHGKRSQDTSTQVHLRAMQTVMSFLLLFASYFLSLILTAWSSNRKQNKLFFLLCDALEFVYPSSHSFILIWGNQKLKQAFLLVFWQVNSWLKEWIPSRHRSIRGGLCMF